VGSVVGSGGLSLPVALSAIGVGGTLVAQGVSNIIAGVTPSQFNPLRSSITYAATSVGLSNAAGEKIYYGAEIFTGVISIGAGAKECAKIVIRGTKTVQASYTFLHTIPVVGAGKFTLVRETFRYTRIIHVRVITRIGAVLPMLNDYYQLDQAVDGWIENGNEENGFVNPPILEVP
jgi:hypothetical protein